MTNDQSEPRRRGRCTGESGACHTPAGCDLFGCAKAWRSRRAAEPVEGARTYNAVSGLSMPELEVLARRLGQIGLAIRGSLDITPRP